MKIVINTCFGGFSLSKEAYEYLGIPWDDDCGGYDFNNDRTNPKLIECIETLGSEKASGMCAKLKVIDIELNYEISNYDGREEVVVQNNTWQ